VPDLPHQKVSHHTKSSRTGGSLGAALTDQIAAAERTALPEMYMMLGVRATCK